MSIVEGTIVKPVSIEDVKKVLGVTENDLGKLCKSDKINMWCRYKPVPYPSYSETKRWKLGVGIYIGDFSDTPEDIALADVGAYKWIYQRPTGAKSSPYRLTDFMGYNPDCRCPLTFSMPKDIVYGDLSNGVSINFDEDVSSANVTLNDIFLIEEYGDFRLSLAILDDNVVKCWFFGPQLNGLDGNSTDTDYKNVTIRTGALKQFNLTNNKVYTGVLMLTNYPSNGDFTNIENGITAEQMRDSHSAALSIEPEEGMNRFNFTYKDSYLQNVVRVWEYQYYFMFENRIKYSNSMQMDVYSFPQWIIQVDKTTARLIADGSHEIQIEAAVYSAHYVVDYDNGVVTSQITANNRYILDKWRNGTDYLVRPEYNANENARWDIALSDYLPNVTYKDGLNDKNIVAGFFFDARGSAPIGEDYTEYKVVISAKLRALNQKDSEITLSLIHINVQAGKDYYLDVG